MHTLWHCTEAQENATLATWLLPDDNNVNVFMPCGESLQAEAMYYVDMRVQLLSELNIETFCGGGFAERRIQGALEADMIPLD